MKKRRQSPADTRTQDSEQLGLFAYEIDEDPLETPITNHAGLPAVLETFRVLGGREAVERSIRLKERKRGFAEADLVEAFIALLAAGGECPEDFETLRADVGLAQLLGGPLPSRSPARQFLYAFHDEALMDARPAREEQAAWVPEESAPLSGLDRVNRTLVRETAAQEEEGCACATLDMAASIIESHKREAYKHYEGGRGYQRDRGVGGEGLIVATSSATGTWGGSDPLSVVARGFAALAGAGEPRTRFGGTARATKKKKSPELAARSGATGGTRRGDHVCGERGHVG